MANETKQAFYASLLQQAEGLMYGESDIIANMANISALLYHGLTDVNWAGFYIFKDQQLVLGPFQGQPACIRIPLGKGVCGTSAAQRTVQVVEDVHKFDGHIACDAASNSEVVVPIIHEGNLVGVLDIDSPEYARFDQDDASGLEKIVDALVSTLS